jgi:hypothetical protein
MWAGGYPEGYAGARRKVRERFTTRSFTVSTGNEHNLPSRLHHAKSQRNL